MTSKISVIVNTKEDNRSDGKVIVGPRPSYGISDVTMRETSRTSLLASSFLMS